MIHVFDYRLGVILFTSETLFMKLKVSLTEFALNVVTLLTITVMSANPDVRPEYSLARISTTSKGRKRKKRDIRSDSTERNNACRYSLESLQ
jgi:hypothetical protein